MGRRKELILRRLTDEGQTTLEFLRALNADQWERRIYSEGSQWSVRQILCHFVSAEDGFLRLAWDILSGGQGAPPGMDVDVFNEREVARMLDLAPDELLERFDRLRGATIGLVSGIEEADLDREGRHPFFGRSSLEKLFKLVYRHNMIHLRDVRRALGEDAPG